MTFKNAAVALQADAMTQTENGMASRKTSALKVLDLFGNIGSARGQDLSAEFIAAVSEHEELAMRCLLWARDIRGGAGERGQFRALVSVLEKHNPVLAGKIMHKIPELGRWDDLFVYSDPINRKNALRMYADAIMNEDGLAAKWAPREKSSKRAIAKELRSVLQMTPKEYRKTLAGLTSVVETRMCAKNWDSINFSHVPSLASSRYQKAFGRNASEAYGEYLRELQKPGAERNPAVKINAGAVYPYDIVHSVYTGNAAVASEQWKALPNFMGDAKLLPIIDVSSSMGSMGKNSRGPDPMLAALSLGLYASEKNTSDFKDMFITFSAKSDLVMLKGSLSERIAQLKSADWGMNTNLQAAFDGILDVAIAGNVASEDMPEVLLLLSDMQFDVATRVGDYSYFSNRSVTIPDFNMTAQEAIKRKYALAGYEMPRIVFWNLRNTDDTPVRFDDRGVCHVSGFSPNIMKTVLGVNELENFTPLNVMIKTLMDERYSY